MTPPDRAGRTNRAGRVGRTNRADWATRSHRTGQVSAPPPDPAPGPGHHATTTRTGAALVLGCYVLWGFFPLYFRLLSAAGSLEVIGNRVVWTLATCLVLTAVRHRWRVLWSVASTPGLLGTLAVSGALVSLNWLVYVYGVTTGRTADAALGYFINPLATVALAALVLGERLRRAQVVAVGLAAAGVVVLVVLQGSLPWISLALALSFSLYGLVKKQVGTRVDALTGVAVETAAMSPLALAYLGWLAAHESLVVQASPLPLPLVVLLVAAGPVTALPLLLFAAGTRQVPLSLVGLSQYLTPITQFLLAWAVFREDISPARWAAMALVWAAVAVLVTDTVRQVARRPRPHLTNP
ncbi:EamA family transporter RarD [Actinomyces lilanjuaniae]|uniref:EamA family transporter RarD n=1 Tax=Actinomyces lilanjuaniae TaxID=2321394 RepID=A0ABM6Z2R6_9ACTO|nr:EamA family transporter RarD [Actinomyces lilanjuaniae]AYD89561.1 EamA family transporter RarD [Actinomyces lilanjuaniae]